MFLSALYLVMILFSVSDADLNFDARLLVQKYGPAVCPYTNFCYTNASEKLDDTSDEIPCCAPCSCEDNCWEFGNCCPDKVPTHNTDQLLPVCKDSMTKQPHYIKSGRRDYFVIDHCPRGTKNVRLLQKCQFANRTSIEDYVWVSDKLTGKIYENKYCALCNAVVDVLPWRILTTCDYFLTIPFSQAVEYILSDSCAFINEAPESLSDVTNKYACQIPTFSQCNTTGFGKHYVEEVDTACNAFTSVFVHYTIFGPVTFKNIFCYICNLVGTELKRCLPEFRDNTRTTIKDFTALLDIGLLTQSEELNTMDGQCGIDEIMDTFTVRCRKLTCPFGSSPFYGRCTKLAKSIIGLGIGVQFYMKIIWGQSTVSASRFYGNDREQTARKIFTGLEKLLGLRKGECNLCSRKMFIDRQNGQKSQIPGFSIFITVATTTKCQPDLISAQATSFFGQQINVHISKNESIECQVNIETRNLSSFEEDPAQELVFNSRTFFCLTTYTLDKVTSCPKIEVRADEIMQLQNSEQRRIFKTWFENGEYEIDICWDAYLSALSRSNDAVKCGDVILITSTILSLLLFR